MRGEMDFSKFAATIIALRSKYNNDSERWKQAVKLTREDCAKNCPQNLAQFDAALLLAEMTELEKKLQ